MYTGYIESEIGIYVIIFLFEVTSQLGMYNHRQA